MMTILRLPWTSHYALDPRQKLVKPTSSRLQTAGRKKIERSK